MLAPSELHEMLWIAGIVFIVFAILLIVCSVIMWYKKEKLSKLAYIASLILTMILYFMNIYSLYDSYLEKGIFEIILLVLGIVFILSSIFFLRKEHITKMKIVMNIATIIGFVLFGRIVCILN